MFHNLTWSLAQVDADDIMHLFLRRAWHVRTNGVDEAKGPLRAAGFRPVPAVVSSPISRSTVVRPLGGKQVMTRALLGQQVKSAGEVGDVSV